jgi:hypothetical protein
VESMRIEAKVIDHRDPNFWYSAELHGCQLQKTLESQEERFAVGSAELPAGTLLTFRIAGGDDEFEYEDYWIVQVEAQSLDQTLGGGDHSYPRGYLRGPLEILAQGRGKERARRLQRWWLEWAPSHGGQTAEMARWLGQQVRQGQELPEAPAFPGQGLGIRFHPTEAWKFPRINQDKNQQEG